MDRNAYILEDTGDLISPSLIYYKDIIFENTKRIIEMAGGAERLWPHVKSHKTAEMIRMQIALGIDRFKCATIAEAEMTSEAGGSHIILAYPLVGPNISRFIHLVKDHPQIVYYAIGDDFDCLAALAKETLEAGINMNVLIDVDIGMHRTGVSLETLESFYVRVSSLKGITLKGLHCYDGHCLDREFTRRKAKTEESDRYLLQILKSLREKGYDCETLVMGGSPSFPCRTGNADFYLSPGTIFIGDWAYYSKLPDLAFTPGAALFSRVVSRQSGNTFTIDLGSKGIAADPVGVRGIIAGLEEASPLLQSEEHWVFSLPSGIAAPPIGSGLYVIPTHICPTSALYSEIQAASGGKITEQWKVRARDRRINY